MASLNKVILIGNLGLDPEVRYTAGGSAVANLRVATTDRFRDRDGNVQEKTEWHRVVVWGRQAEQAKEYLRKGRQIYVEGALETREWTDKEGMKRYTTEIKARQILFLGPREGGGEGSGGPSRYHDAAAGGGGRSEGYGGGGRSAADPARPAAGPGPWCQPEEDGFYAEAPEGISEEDIPF